MTNVASIPYDHEPGKPAIVRIDDHLFALGTVESIHVEMIRRDSLIASNVSYVVSFPPESGLHTDEFHASIVFSPGHLPVRPMGEPRE